MPQVADVAILIGSLRKKSFNRRLAHALPAFSPPGLSLRSVEIGNVPFYNADLEEEAPPPAWQWLREGVGSADAVLFVTPEYNRSVPAVLKNAVDVLSRPAGRSVLARKPAAIISSSPGALGGFGASQHLRQSLVCVNALTMAAPEAYLGNIGSAFDEAGRMTNPGTGEFLGKFMSAFEQWIRLVGGK